jgi:dihydroorotate dehydrogenase (NAD+) catalytic subunit
MKKIDLSGEIAGLRVDPAILIPSGFLAYPGALNAASLYTGGYILKTTGDEERSGNETPNSTDDLNCMGLPDPGYEAMIREIRANPPLKGKVVIASISSRSEEGIGKVATAMDKVPYIHAFEINISCPNVKPEERLGVTIGYDEDRLRSYVRTVMTCTEKPVFVKAGPALYSYDPKKFIKNMAAALEEGADGIAAINTIPGGMEIDIYARCPVLSAGCGGVSGPGIKKVGIGCVYTLNKELRGTFKKMSIIGGGGIENEDDVIEYVLAGADVVCIGTKLRNMSTHEKNRFFKEMAERLEKKLNELEPRYGFPINRLLDIRGRTL